MIKAVAPGRPLQNDRYVLGVIHVFGRLVVGRGQLLSCCRGRCFGSFLFAYSQMINLIRSEKRYKTNRFLMFLKVLRLRFDPLKRLFGQFFQTDQSSWRLIGRSKMVDTSLALLRYLGGLLAVLVQSDRTVGGLQGPPASR